MPRTPEFALTAMQGDVMQAPHRSVAGFDRALRQLWTHFG